MLYLPTPPVPSAMSHAAVPAMSLDDCDADCHIADVPGYGVAPIDLPSDYAPLHRRESASLLGPEDDDEDDESDVYLSRPDQNSSRLAATCIEPSTLVLPATSIPSEAFMPSTAFIINENLEMASRAFYATIHKFANQNCPEFRRRSPYTFLENWHLHSMYSKSQQILLGYPIVKPTVLLSGDDYMYTAPLIQEDPVMDDLNWDDEEADIGFDHDYLMLDNGVMMMTTPTYTESGTDVSEPASAPADVPSWIPRHPSLGCPPSYDAPNGMAASFMDDDEADPYSVNLDQPATGPAARSILDHYFTSGLERLPPYAFNTTHTDVGDVSTIDLSHTPTTERHVNQTDGQTDGNNESIPDQGVQRELFSRLPSSEISDATQNDFGQDDRLSIADPTTISSYQSLADILPAHPTQPGPSEEAGTAHGRHGHYGTVDRASEPVRLMADADKGLFRQLQTQGSRASDRMVRLTVAIVHTADRYAKRHDPLNGEERGQHGDDQPPNAASFLLHVFYISQILFLCADLLLFGVLMGGGKRSPRAKKDSNNLYRTVSMV